MRSSDTLHRALDDLVAQGRLEPEQARAVIEEMQRLSAETPVPVLPEASRTEAAPAVRGERLVEMLAYLGGALVLAACVVIATLLWEDLSKPSRVAMSLGAAVVLLGVATLLTPAPEGWTRLPWRGVRGQVSAALAAFASGAVALGVATAFDTPTTSAEDLLLWAGLAMGAVALGAYAVWRGYLLVVAMIAAGGLLVGYAIPTFGFEDHVGRIGGLVIAFGIAVILLGRLTPEHLVSDTIGALIATMGLQTLNSDQQLAGVGLALSLVFIAALFAAFLRDYGVQFAIVGGYAALMLPTTALGVLTDSALAVALTLLAVGLLLILGAVFVVRRRNDHHHHPGSHHHGLGAAA